ncbi:olfactory receptor 14J1-like [Tachyglossus aculeatus]|uniref:olfactory receptor 14J1-like n=1 Tax=Tachyglossus aculeatus TaxID=9261 RepID=UPI0018F4F6D1|nr:olfactory receptor 14J1-like [Tachyglossus aculeatus]
MVNVTTVTGFLLLGFSEVRELQLVHATLFLLVFLVALTGNLLIVTVTILDRRLHTPMYFFLRNLSLIDVCYISTTVPKSILNSLTNVNSISLPACVVQVFLVIFLGGSELALLTVMSHDPCASMLAASWLSGSLISVMYTASTFSLSFCGPNDIHQFFCEGPQLLRLTCSASHIAEHVSLTLALCLSFLCFVLIVILYVRIFRAVVRMPAAEGRAKAFSTCLPHLVVVTLFTSSGFFAYLKPISDSPSALDLLVSVFYAVVPPTLNPLIYSLRNRDMKAAMNKLLGQESFGKEKLCQVNFSPS